MKEKLVILTPSGISSKSGLNTFCDSGGLWERYDINKVATLEGWSKNSELVLEFYNLRRKNILAAKPNVSHFSLVELKDNFEVTISTQNIDDLHERAGSTNVVHLHGEILKIKKFCCYDLMYDCRNDFRLGDKCKRGFQLRPCVV